MGLVKEMMINKGISEVIAGYLYFSIELILLVISIYRLFNERKTSY
ncbi:hypothetical protein I6U48_27390 [Clostridium sp. PL3]|uniref:Uncharacterized protein n=1 Tax=Clostridium thailandense TaxID=2794346 RepID=A0A949U3A0_9CLOT|nr:hypothetical protein [Clostridium thailandense]MBV7276601.1 hypothetical protein [Clostridium thailandense]